jgi:hypothetical protein
MMVGEGATAELFFKYITIWAESVEVPLPK